MREKVKRMRQELNESREAQQKRINIERSRARLSRMLRENSKTKHLPEALRYAVMSRISPPERRAERYTGTFRRDRGAVTVAKY